MPPQLRMLMYLAETYKEYIAQEGLDLYAPAAEVIPRPELYVVYTGRRKNVPETLRLSDLYAPEGKDTGGSGVELRARVLRGDGSKSIIDQ